MQTLEILEVDELSQAAGCAPITVLRAIREGKIRPARKVGRSHLFLPHQVEQMRGLMKKPRHQQSAVNG